MHVQIPQQANAMAACRVDGPWWVDTKGDQGPYISCANNHRAFLTCHNVGADGVVHPSVVCSEPNCTWHVMATLVGWANGVRKGLPRDG